MPCPQVRGKTFRSRVAGSMYLRTDYYGCAVSWPSAPARKRRAHRSVALQSAPEWRHLMDLRRCIGRVGFCLLLASLAPLAPPDQAPAAAPPAPAISPIQTPGTPPAPPTPPPPCPP